MSINNNSDEYKLCELKTRLSILEKDRLSLRSRFIHSICPDKLHHIRQKYSDLEPMSTTAVDTTVDLNCELIEL